MELDGGVDPPADSSLLLECLLEPVTQTPPQTPALARTLQFGSPEAKNDKSDADDRPWVCEQCGFRFKYKNNLTEHMRFYHMKGSVPCSKCSQVFLTSKHLRQHRKNHAVEQGRCPHCRYLLSGTNNNPELYQEMYKQHLPMCRRCPAKSRRKHTNNPESNPQCQRSSGKTFSHMQNSNISEVSTGLGSYVLSCRVCNRKFTDLVEYETHRCNRKFVSFTQNHVPDPEQCQEINTVYTELDVPSYEKLDVQSASTKIDFNFLCIICGVNFENEERLNLHLYENHQTCDQDTPKENSSPTENSNNNPFLLCEICSDMFHDASTLEKHQLECKSKTENLQIEVIGANVSKEIKQEVLNDEISSSDVMVCWLCKYCKATFSNKAEMRVHKIRCAMNNISCDGTLDSSVEQNGFEDDTPESFTITNFSDFSAHVSPMNHTTELNTSSVETNQEFTTPVVDIVWDSQNGSANFAVPCADSGRNGFHCENCDVSFINESELTSHGQECKNNSAADSTELIVQWLCRYCKASFSTKDEMRTHKELCALEHRSFLQKGVLVKWVCKHCKKDFDTRESMQKHKTTCPSRNRDKLVMSSTESDKSEVISKEVAHRNPSSQNDNKTMLILEETDTELAQDKMDSIVVVSDDDINKRQPCADQMDSNGDLSSNKPNSSLVINAESENEEASQGILIHDYSLNDIEAKAVISSPENHTAQNDNINNNNDSKVECSLLPESSQEDGVLVKWVCKYCKDVFDDRSEMSVHKKVCKTIFSSAESEMSEMVQIHPTTQTSGDKGVVLGGMNNGGNVRDLVCTQPAIKIKIKLKHLCIVCGKRFPIRKLLRAHNLQYHMNKCRCGRYFGNSSLLWKHSRMCRATKMPPEKKKLQIYSCKRCYRVFREKYKYNLHKGSCQHQKLDSKEQTTTISLPHEKILLRIQCHRCSGSYVGREIISLHTCEKPRDVKAQLCCVVCMESFSSITSFCTHSTNCALNLPGVSPNFVPSRILCHSCLRQFSSIFFFYLHLISGTCGNDFFKDCFHSSDVKWGNTESPIVNNSPSYSSSDGEENEEWTCCSFCSVIFPSSIPKLSHYQMCCKRSESMNLTNITRKSSKRSNDLGVGWPYRTLKIMLRRLPEHLIPKYPENNLLESESDLSTLNLKQTTVQRCVICHKRCRFSGTRLPPIGQLECFRCREKVHRKELKKRGEKYHCRSVFDEDLVPMYVDQLTTQASTSNTYLDPSKRLKVSRAMLKSKLLNQEKEAQEYSAFGLNRVRPTKVITPPASSNTGTLKTVQKCSHCKRCFRSKEQLDKHMKLSKTCFHAEMTRAKHNNLEREKYIDHSSSIINFVDFISNVPHTLSLDHNGFTEMNRDVAPYSDPRVKQINSDIRTDTPSPVRNDSFNHSKVFVSSKKDKCLGTTAVLLRNPEGQGPKTTFLVLDDAEKALRSRSIMKRLPSSPALQCDGWILESSVHKTQDGTKKLKLICGACYRSFSNDTLFLEHAFSVHQLSKNAAAKLNIMKHIPKEELNKVSW